jgi:hypothetical protein
MAGGQVAGEPGVERGAVGVEPHDLGGDAAGGELGDDGVERGDRGALP